MMQRGKYKTREHPEVLTNSEITQIAVEALFYVYESGTTPTALKTVGKTFRRTGQTYHDCNVVVDKLIEQSYLVKTDKSKEYLFPEVAFGTKGLWLLEDAFAHGEEVVDSMAFAERIFTREHFFEAFNELA